MLLSVDFYPFLYFDSQVREIELEDNMSLFKYRQDVEKKTREIDQLQTKLEGHNQITIEREKTEVEKRKVDLNKQVW